jgi:hypothetical protein
MSIKEIVVLVAIFAVGVYVGKSGLLSGIIGGA